jgi:hypothetical protein
VVVLRRFATAEDEGMSSVVQMRGRPSKKYFTAEEKRAAHNAQANRSRWKRVARGEPANGLWYLKLKRERLLMRMALNVKELDALDELIAGWGK